MLNAMVGGEGKQRGAWIGDMVEAVYKEELQQCWRRSYGDDVNVVEIASTIAPRSLYLDTLNYK